MKNRFACFLALLAVATGAAGLGGCHRAAYAVLPKGRSYYAPPRAAPRVSAGRPAAPPLPTGTLAPAVVVSTGTKQPAARVTNRGVAATAAKPAAVAAVPGLAAAPPKAAVSNTAGLSPLTTATARTRSLAVADHPPVREHLAHRRTALAWEKVLRQANPLGRSNSLAAVQRRNGVLVVGLAFVLGGLLVGIIGTATFSGNINLYPLVGVLLVVTGLALVIGSAFKKHRAPQK